MTLILPSRTSEVKVQDQLDYIATLWPNAVTELPINPINGQRVNFVADLTSGNVWELVHLPLLERGVWKYMGGSPIRNLDTGTQPRNTASAEYQTTGAPRLITPIEGTWDCIFGARYILNGAGVANDMRLGLHVGGTPIEDTGIIATAGGIGACVRHCLRVTSIAAEAEVSVRYRSVSAQSANFWSMYLEMVPVTVG